jgi:hypothetical protein
MLSANVQLYEIHICRFIHALGVTLFPRVRAWKGQAKSGRVRSLLVDIEGGQGPSRAWSGQAKAADAG